LSSNSYFNPANITAALAIENKNTLFTIIPGLDNWYGKRVTSE